MQLATPQYKGQHNPAVTSSGFSPEQFAQAQGGGMCSTARQRKGGDKVLVVAKLWQ